MIPILSCAQMRAYDAHAIDRCHVAGAILMENAGLGAAEIAAELLGDEPEGVVVVVCGRGNNGGDGFVLARHLMTRSIVVEVFVLADRNAIAGDARLHLEALIGLGGSVSFLDDDLTELQDALADATLAVDALFGTGLTRAPEGRYADAIGLVNGALCPVLALDVPSGIDADRGAVLGVAVRADTTATFGHLKTGLLQGPAVALAGDIEIVGLGIPDGAILDDVGFVATAIDPDDVSDTLGARPIDAHKYSAGNVLIVAGSRGKTGAAVLAARGAQRAGAGLCTIATWPDAADAIENAHAGEVMTARLDPADLERSLELLLDRRTAIAIGPGLGLDEDARRVSDALVLGWEGPVVVDADAISHFAGRPSVIRNARGPRVLTPHAGELARLLGTTSADIEADRFSAARRAADLTGATVLLKGPNTLVAGPEATEVCLIGNALLATAGSGDVLTGIIAALLCGAASAVEAADAAAAGVYLHALSADRWRERVASDRGMLASEIADELPAAIATLLA